MRISERRSDVCSSDLDGGGALHQRGDEGDAVLDAQLVVRIIGRVAEVGQIQRLAQAAELPVVADGDDDVAVAGRKYLIGYRSEEHTSELQSLMRISYAVFCLKKKKKQIKTLLASNYV